MLGSRYRGSTCAREHTFHLSDVAVGDLQGVKERCAGDYCGSMLVVVKNRDAKRFAQLLFYIEAVGRADVLEIDASHTGLEQLAEANDVVRILRPDLEIEHIEVSELLEKIPLALHYGLSSKCTDVAEAEDCGSVRYDCDEVAAGCVFVGVFGVLLDLEAGLSN